MCMILLEAGVCNLRSAESRETVDVATAGSIAPTAGTSSAGASTSGGISTLNRTESLKPLVCAFDFVSKCYILLHVPNSFIGVFTQNVLGIA